MDLFGDWIATKKGMLDTLLAMIESGEIAHAHTQTELLAAIDDILNAGRATGEFRADISAEDIAASLLGIFTVARPPQHATRASRLLYLLMDGLRSTPFRIGSGDVEDPGEEAVGDGSTGHRRDRGDLVARSAADG